MEKIDEPVWGDPDATWEQPVESMPDITLKAFEKLIEDAFTMRKAIDEAEEDIKTAKGQLETLKNKIMTYMVQFKKDNYKTTHGMIIRKKEWRVTTPKTPEDKTAFYAYLKEKGIFEELVTVHSKTLNSFVQQELDAAKESGDIDFKVPGIEEPKVFESITFRKK